MPYFAQAVFALGIWVPYLAYPAPLEESANRLFSNVDLAEK
jgi:hypothetical protein